MTRKLGPDEVVPGFDLAKYAPLETASLADWYVQVTGRYTVWCLLHAHPGASLGRNILQRIIDAGMLGEESMFFDERPVPLTAEERSRRTVSVDPITAEMLFEVAESIARGNPLTGCEDDEDHAGMWESLFNLRQIERTIPSMRTRNMIGIRPGVEGQFFEDHSLSVDALLTASAVDLKERSESIRYAHVRVDLDTTEATAIAEFRNWFKAERQARGFRRHGGATVRPADWYRDRVIPFIDLDLWARSKGATWSARELAARLYPDDDDDRGERNIETVRKTADKLMRPPTRRRLAAEAAREPV